MIDIAVIPVAGRGLNLLPLTKSQPKEMLPVGNKPVVQHVVDELIACDVKRFLFVTGPDKTAIENHFDTNKELIRFLRVQGREEQLAELAFERNEATYFFTRQRHQNGLGQAVLCAESFVRECCFVVALGDTILGRHTPSDIVRRMLRIFEQKRDEIHAVVAFDPVLPEEVSQYGIGRPGKDYGDYFELDDIIEKPGRDEAPSRLAVAARYVFSPEIFRYLHQIKPGIEGQLQLTDAIRLMIRDGKKILGVPLPETDRRYDIGNFDSYFKAFVDFVLHDPQRDGVREFVEKQGTILTERNA